MRHIYKITKQYTRGPESTFAERFNQLLDAKAFVQTKLAEDATMNVKALYRIYEDDDVHSEYDQSKLETASSAKETSDESAQGKGRSASFRPTPLNTTPRPAGTPAKWIKDSDEEEKDKK